MLHKQTTLKIMSTDSGYMVRTNREEYFFSFFHTLEDLVAYIKFSGSKDVLVDDVSVSLSEAIEISKQLDGTYTFIYDGIVHRNWEV